VSGATARPVFSVERRWATLRTRTVSALLLAPPVLFIVHLGGPWFALMTAAGGVVLSWEWARLCRGSGRVGSGRVGSGRGGIVAAAVVVLSIAAAAIGRLDLALLVVTVGGAAVFVVERGDIWSSAGVFYVGLPAAAFVWLRGDPEAGRLIVFWLLASVWAYDVGAFGFGRLIGGPRLAPAISPNKTWAGCIGGSVCAAIAGTVTLATLGGVAVGWAAPVVSGALGVAAQAGDLFESGVKRRFNVKDASGLIPGHGGLLDRVDGLIAATAVAALIVMFGHGSIRPWM
jgi:phosphatidate cytidylyltransferase